MKNTAKKIIDPMLKARRHPKFKEYSKDARARILLATAIYDARVKQGLSQQKLAKNAQTTQKVISKVENGQVNFGVDLLFKILQNLKLKMQVGAVSLK
ncbi:MAG: helix-turn-helix transcriptional regulator [Candidatus Jacksonbacteria bacterium]